MFGSAAAGLLAARFGERRLWTSGLLGRAALGVLLMFILGRSWVALYGLFFGLVSAIEWVGAIAMVQIVPGERRGKANSTLMIASSLGSIAGPLLGRVLLTRTAKSIPPAGSNFMPVFALLIGLILAGSALVWTQSRVAGTVFYRPPRLGSLEIP